MRLQVSQGHQTWYHSIYLRYGFLLVCYSNNVRFWDIRLQICRDLETGLGVRQGHWNVTIRQSAYDFLLTFHSKHRPISYRYRDSRRFPSKIAKFFHPLYLVFCAPLKGSPWNWVSALGIKKLEWWGYQAEQKFDGIFSRLDTIQQRDRQTDRHRAIANTALTHSVAL